MIAFIETIEQLAKSENLRSGSIEKFTEELLKKSADLLNCQRTNAWLLNEANTELRNLKSYVHSADVFIDDETLHREDLPHYFFELTRNELIVSNVAREAKINKELVNIYIDPLNITSMIDVPLRAEGKMIGVICFEHVSTPHEWSINEQKFTLSVAQLLSLALETHSKNEYQKELEKSLHEKELLIKEINHRVKNNLSIIISLLNIQKNRAKDDYHNELFTEVINKVFSMSSVQHQLHNSGRITDLPLTFFVKDIVENLNEVYTNHNVKIDYHTNDEININIDKAIPFGLIVNEIITNSFKYAFNNIDNPSISVTITKNNGNAVINLKDNGVGFDENKIKKGAGLGLIFDLADQLDGKVEAKKGNGTEYTISFQF
ncbi:MAG: GAF domain-containing protein [Flavobacteriales bacterium]|nr:GAF domain-containing protein [Flavobacteriales bacterium]